MIYGNDKKKKKKSCLFDVKDIFNDIMANWMHSHRQRLETPTFVGRTFGTEI